MPCVNKIEKAGSGHDAINDSGPEDKNWDDLDRPGDWPRKLWVIAYSVGNMHGVRCYNGQHGLAAFKKKEAAKEFATFVRNPPCRAWKLNQLDFEEAKELAASKADPINCLILSDSVPPLVLPVK